MKNFMTKAWCFFIGLLLIANAVNADAQTRELRTSEGTDFVFSFMPNMGGQFVTDLILFISSKVPVSGTVYVAKLDLTIPFTTQPNVVTTVVVPGSLTLMPVGVKSKYGIRVTSDFPISIYAMNKITASTDVFLVLPVASLGKDYFAASYNGVTDGIPSYISIVGTEDGTQVKITSPVATSNAAAGAEQIITLNKLETFLIGGIGNSDLTGIKIESTAPVALTSGARGANIPVGVFYADHLAEMMPPLTSWGQSFLTLPLATRLRGDLIRVLASVDNTEVTINDAVVATLAKGAYYDVISLTANVIKTSAPAFVTQYSMSAWYDSTVSDPFMMSIVPTEQFLDSYTFATPLTDFRFHAANVVIRTRSIDSVRLDGQLVDSALFKPIGDGLFSGAQLPIAAGSHRIVADVPFGLYVYGFGINDSYGYPGGMALELINPIHGDYKNVRVVSSLATQGAALDFSSFTIEPEKITELDGYTKLEWFFPEFAIGQIKNLDYEIQATNLLPGEKRTITNSLEMSYQDLHGVEHRRSLGKQELEVLASGFTLDLNTDKTIYGPQQSVQISTRVANAGATQELVSLTTDIRDLQGNLVASVNVPPAFILAGGDAITLTPQEFMTGNTYAGDYVVEATLKNQAGIVLVESSAFIKIAPESAVQVSLTTATDQLAYTVNDSLLIESNINNLSTNSFLDDATVVARIFTQGGELVWSESSELNQLVPGASEVLRTNKTLTDAAVGSYTLQVSIIDKDGVVLTTDQANFDVRNNLLLSLSGTVSVQHNELVVGEQQHCTYTFKNGGTKPVSQLPIQLRMVRVDQPAELFAANESVSVNAGAEQVFTPELTQLTAAGDYACVLEVIIDGVATALANSLFTVKESALSLEAGISFGEKGRLLVLIDGPLTPDNIELSYLTQVLDAAGWFYTLVDRDKDFNYELSSGGYSAYALLSEGVTLSLATRERLKAEVALGDGLVVSNSHDRRHRSLEEVLGVHVHSKPVQAEALNIQQSAMGDGWSYNFNPSVNSLTFEPLAANIVGSYTLANVQHGDNGKSLGVASDFNVFVLENFTSQASSIEGRLAVGSNLNIKSFNIGENLAGANVIDSVIVGGNVTFSSGRLYYGSLKAAGAASVSSIVRSNLSPDQLIHGYSVLPVNFENEAGYLQQLSGNLVKLSATGSAVLQSTNYELKGDCTSSLQLFNLDAVTLAKARTYSLNCIPNGATVVFNVAGENITMQNLNMQSLTDIRDKVLFNFPQAKKITLTSVAIAGSVLAPYAEITQPTGVVEGQVIAKSWLSGVSKVVVIRNHLFSGDLSAAWVSSTNNALSHHQYQLGKTVFAGFDVLAHAYSLNSILPEGEQNGFANLFLSSLAHVNPDVSLARPGKVVPLLVTMINPSEKEVSGVAKLSVAEQFTVVGSGGFTKHSQATNWNLEFALAPKAQLQKTVYVQLPVMPEAGGEIGLLVEAGVEPDQTTLVEARFTLTSQ